MVKHRDTLPLGTILRSGTTTATVTITRNPEELSCCFLVQDTVDVRYWPSKRSSQLIVTMLIITRVLNSNLVWSTGRYLHRDQCYQISRHYRRQYSNDNDSCQYDFGHNLRLRPQSHSRYFFRPTKDCS